MQLKPLAFCCVILLASTAQAGGAWGGALGGLGDALQRQAELDQQADEQKELILQQHNLEMERMRYQFEMQRQAQERAAQQQAAQRAADDAAAERQVEAAHPGWRAVVKTSEFHRWRQMQPASVQQLGASSRPQDAILMLDLFKRDRPNWQLLK
jgi:hypothetical protein